MKVNNSKTSLQQMQNISSATQKVSCLQLFWFEFAILFTVKCKAYFFSREKLL